MKFSDYEFFPGVVTDVADPKYLGRVKATVPTVFDASMDKEGLPWVRPFTMLGYQGFSKMREGSKIWVIRNIKNRNEFWYVPMFELNQDTRELLNDDEKYENGDVLLSRNNGNNSIYIYYNDTDGIMIKYGDQNLININSKSEITVQAGEGKVFIKDNKVYLGDGDTGSSQKAVMGDDLKTQLNKINQNFTKIRAAFPTMVPYPQKPPQLDTISSDVLAKNTFVD